MDLLSLVKRIIYSSIKNLFNNQPDIFKFTSRTNMTEWNLAHHLANELSKYIFWLDNDLDVIKINHNNQRPDIIFHKREIDKLNFLVIELKRTNDKKGIQHDIEKIEKILNDFSYGFGASIVIENKTDWYGVIFERSCNSTKFISKENIEYLPLPSNENMKCQIKCLVSEIFNIIKSDDYGINQQKQAQVEELKKQIDQLVYKLYNLTDEEVRIIEGNLNNG